MKSAGHSPEDKTVSDDSTSASLGESSRRVPRTFWTFWSCFTAGSLADGISLIAVTWVAATLTSDALLVAAVGMAERLPWLLGALPAGSLADRLPRLALMACSLSCRALIMAAIGLLVFTDRLTIAALMALAMLLGTTEVVTGVAGESVVPRLVSRPQLPRANGHLRSSQIVGNDFAGRPLGGALLRVGLWAPFAGGALLTAIAAVVLLVVRRSVGDPRPASPSTDVSASRPVLGRDAIRLVWDVRLLRVLLLAALVLNTLYGALLGVQVLFVRDAVGLDSLGFAFLLAGSAVGGLLGSQLASSAVARLGVLRALLSALLVMALAFLGVGLARSPIVVALLYAIASGAVALWSVTTLSLRQDATPDGLLGRVNATFRMVTFGVSAIGMLVGGLAVDLASKTLDPAMALRLPYIFTAIAYLITLLVVARSLRGDQTVREAQERLSNAQDVPSGR